MYEKIPVAIIGGGLAGLTASIALAKAGLDVLLIERKTYPFHRVCGEYISNEVRPYLSRLGVDIDSLKPAELNRFVLSAPSGRLLETTLDLGGFGISRYKFDHYLYKYAQSLGVRFMLGAEVQELRYEKDTFRLLLNKEEQISAEVVLGGFGKRSRLDKQLERPFFQQRSPWVAIKYHVSLPYPADTIGLYNFRGGYCGVNKLEDDRYCLCYLTSRDELRKHGKVEALEEKVLYKNPVLGEIFQSSTFLYERPEAINEVSFEAKEPVFNHVLMTGDAAGMIAPLCGNGMAMAVHAAKLVSESVISYFAHRDRNRMEREYALNWQKHFGRRLWTGRQFQKLFGQGRLSETAVLLGKQIPAVSRFLISKTHGKPF